MKIHTAYIAFLLSASGLTFAQSPVKQLVISAKVVRVPVGSPAIKETGLVFDANGAPANLGVITTEKAAVMLAALEKAEGASIMGVPSVTTNSGLRAKVESVHEVSYPTEFEPAKLVNADPGKPVQLAPGQTMAALPAEPKSFEMRPVGFRMEFEAMLDRQGQINLNLAPELVTFMGFLNYGSPIKAAVVDKDGKLSEVVLTENRIPQAVFHRAKVSTSAKLRSGEVLVLGGMGGSEGPQLEAGQKPDAAQSVASLPSNPSNVVFFFIQAKLTGE